MNPQLSVIVACHNAGDTLATQLSALAEQSCPLAWEVLVCDNGSDDDTAAIARSFIGRLPLRVIDAGAVRGAGAARNAGVARTTAPWLAFADADDMVASDWLVQVCEAMAQHRFVAGRFEASLLNSARVRRSRRLEQDTELQRGPQGLVHAGASNMAVHRDVFLAAGGFDESLRILEDTDLCWRIQRRGEPLVFFPAMVMHVRLRATWAGMFAQGRQYGQAFAELRRREAALSASEPTAADQSVGAAQRAADPVGGGLELARGRSVRGRIAQIGAVGEAWCGRPPSAGHLVWQLGWHDGFRQGEDK